jgi:hypothetical protein
MKLKDFFECSAQMDGTRILVEMVIVSVESLTGREEMLPYFETIKSCDEFRQCNLHLMDRPVETIRNRTLMAQTINIGNDMVFTGNCFLYHVSLTPTIYHPDNLEPFRGLIARGVFDGLIR